MPKSSHTLLLLPGETSWELWDFPTPTSAPTLIPTPPAQKPSEISKLPPGDILLLFPVKALTALPLQVPTADPSLFPDLAASHAERLGLRPDPLAGQLTDVFPLFVNSDSSTLLTVILRPPQSADLPTRSPKAFDISPRAYPVDGTTLTLWRELGHWVFTLHLSGKLLYCQATSISTPSPDTSLLREIRIAIAQLTLQGLHPTPTHAIIWSSDPDADPSLLAQQFSLQPTLLPRPAPTLPTPLSRLLPADVRAARAHASRRQTITLTIAALTIAYLGTIAYLAYQLWETHSTTRQLAARIEQVSPQAKAYALHIAKWDELAPAIDLNQNTVDILSRIARSIPQTSGLRLKIADISATNISLTGEAPQVQAINQFSQNLTANNDLATYTWQLQEPRQSARGWEFTFTGSTLTPP